MMPGRAWTAVDRIAEAYLDDTAALDPVAATDAGIPGHDHRLPGLDPAWHDECSHLRRRTLAALAAAEPADPNDRITAAALREQLEAAEELHGAAEDLADLDNVASPHHAIRNVFDLMPTVLRYELDRYLGWPGQAPSYKIGERHLLQLRDQARAAQGAAFDLKSFHRRVLDIGSVGLDVLQAAVLGSEAQ